MMLEVDVNGRTRTVSLERVVPEGGQFRVTIDGRVHVVDACLVDASTLSLILLDAGGASHEVGLIESDVPGELIVWTSEGPVRAVVNGRRSRRVGAEGSAELSGEQRVVAPMSGKVVRVLVAPGTEGDGWAGFGGGRGDENGECAHVAEGRPRQRGCRQGGDVGGGRPTPGCG